MRPLRLSEIDLGRSALIEASAGTGKTWTITALYILLVLERQLRPEEILVVTYTKAATAELRDRIRKRLAATLDLFRSGRPAADELEELVRARRDAPEAERLLTRALYAFDNAAVFTIHSFCQRALQENAFESGSLFDTEMATDQSALVRQVCDDYWRLRILDEQQPFLEWLLARRHSPDTLAAPFDGHFQSRSLKVIPEAGNPDLEQLIAQQSALIRQVAPLWQTEQDAILDQLVRSNLSRTSYKPERVEAAAQQLDQEFKAGHFLNGCTCLLLFTPDKIRSAARKDSHLPDHPFFDLCSRLHAVAQQIEEACQEKLLYHQRALGEWLRDELERRKQALNLRSYDDLLLDLHRALEGAGGERLAAGLRQRYRAALIDEFQDTDPLQWRIFELLAGEGGQSGNALAASPQPELSFGTQWDPAGGLPLFLIGDPKQAIYSFRGADIHAYLSAARSIDRARRWTLGTNRRSSKLLVDGVSALFRRENPFLDHAITYGAVSSGRAVDQQLFRHGTPVTAPLRFWVYRRETPARAAARGAARSAAVAATAAEIAHLLDGSYELVTKQGIRRALRPGDVAVLVKAHYQAELVQQALQDLSVPSVQHGDATIFETAEALDLLRILRAAAEPFRSGLVREALLTGIIGLTADEVHALDRDDSAWDAWILRFRSLQEAMGSGGIMELAAQLLGECGVRRQVLTHERGERRMTNILHCLDLLHQAERLQGIGLESSIVWLERRISGQEQDETYLLRLETDENAVTISTIHASKGLEYPVVFIPFAWEPPPARNGRVLFHDEQGERVLDLGSDRYEENKRTAGAEQDAEAARLLYVALTRAEFLCYLSWGCISGAYDSPLRRLLHGSAYSDAKAFAAADDRQILGGIEELATGDAAGAISALFMPAPAQVRPYRAAADAGQPLSACELHRPIPCDWRMSSFSSIAGGGERHLQPQDRDAAASREEPEGEAVEQRPDRGTTIFGFPRGAAAGTCLHELFETLDYARLPGAIDPAGITACLQRNGYDPQWSGAVAAMVETVVTAPLLPECPEFTLGALTAGSWQTELEFYLPLNLISGERLREAFAGMLDLQRHGDFAGLLADLHLQETRGMLVGFIDMVFEYRGRYYLVDWKSNHLGDRIEDYAPEHLSQAMASHRYILQYHLYALALDRLLRLRLPGYDFETHFGGALYVFLRGVSTDGRCGIFRDRPSAGFVERAGRLLLA